MPDQRLERARETLAVGYQFGGAHVHDFRFNAPYRRYECACGDVVEELTAEFPVGSRVHPPVDAAWLQSLEDVE